MNPEASKYLAAIGRRGGKAKGGAKADTARANGKLGGRPKSKKRVARRSNAALSEVADKTRPN
jgi:general stress protein YciG